MSESIFVPPEPTLNPKLVTVLGTGPFAQVAARVLLPGGTKIRMWGKHTELGSELDGVEVYGDPSAAIDGSSVLIFAVPAGDIEELAIRIGPHVLPDQMVLLASRGATAGFKLPHEHIRSRTCLRKLGVFGGPLHVGELTAGRRINVVIASRFQEVLKKIQELSKETLISYHTTRDVLGVEVAGAVSNVASIAAGLAEGLSLGETAVGMLLAHGIAEARRLGVALGAESETFSGLAGLGELIPRSIRSMERHVELGKKLAQGIGLDTALSQMEGHVEGILTAKEALIRAEDLDIELPLIRAVAHILDGSGDPRPELEAVLGRPLTLAPQNSDFASAF